MRRDCTETLRHVPWFDKDDPAGNRAQPRAERYCSAACASGLEIMGVKHFNSIFSFADWLARLPCLAWVSAVLAYRQRNSQCQHCASLLHWNRVNKRLTAVPAFCWWPSLGDGQTPQQASRSTASGRCWSTAPRLQSVSACAWATCHHGHGRSLFTTACHRISAPTGTVWSAYTSRRVPADAAHHSSAEIIALTATCFNGTRPGCRWTR